MYLAVVSKSVTDRLLALSSTELVGCKNVVPTHLSSDGNVGSLRTVSIQIDKLNVSNLDMSVNVSKNVN